MSQRLASLPVGAKVKFGTYGIAKNATEGIKTDTLKWLIVAKSHSGYPSNSVTLLTEKIIDLRCYDYPETQRPSSDTSTRNKWGSNLYPGSCIDQALNGVGNTMEGWWVSQHSGDYLTDKTNDYAYGYWSGFLNKFTADEKSAILDTTIRVLIPNLDGGGYRDIVRKVFLPSASEIVATENREGTTWSYFASDTRESRRVTQLTQHALSNTRSDGKPSSVSNPWFWRLRTPDQSSPYAVQYISSDGVAGKYGAPSAYDVGIRPALNISAGVTVSDTTDSEGYYTIENYGVPTAPSSITLPATIRGGKANTISWGTATDPNGDSVQYRLEASYDGGEFELVMETVKNQWTTTVPRGHTTVQYRVKAVDAYGLSSAYTTSETKTIVNYINPVISGADGTLGTKTEGFTFTYRVTDANFADITVREDIDGTVISSKVVSVGSDVTAYITGETWLKLSNGVHTFTITATDSSGYSSKRVYTFTKEVGVFCIETITPMESSSMPSRIAMEVTRNIPVGATFKVEVCNNGFDDSPTWEDATQAVVGNLVHVFENTSRTSDRWGVNIRVLVERNNGEGTCYVSAIGGNFE